MELCRRWYPSVYSKAPRKRGQHTALADIQVRTCPALRAELTSCLHLMEQEDHMKLASFQVHAASTFR